MVSSKKNFYKLLIIAPNCFYYQVDVFRQLSEDPRLDLTVCFCSDEAFTVNPSADRFGSDAHPGSVRDMLFGYKSKFLKNYSLRPSYLRSITGLINFGIWSEIRKNKPDGIVLMSWMNPTWWFAVLAATIWGIPFFLMTDANVHTEYSMSLGKRALRKLVLGKLLFKCCSGFLYAGVRNRSLYELYGVPGEKLFPFAYSSGYRQLLKLAIGLNKQKTDLRRQLHIAQDKFVFLFCGRLGPEKNPLELLKAYQLVESSNKALIFVGDGVMMETLTDYVEKHDIDDVYFLGSLGRGKAFEFYAMSDVLVLPSERETWGMVVNEAMCFGLPIIASDAVGANYDLVIHGDNGFTYTSGKMRELFTRMQCLIDMDAKDINEMGERSRQVIQKWSSRDLGMLMCQCLDSSYDKRNR